MKKIIVRIIGSLLILASMAAAFLPACIKLDNVNKRTLRETRTTMIDDLEKVQDVLLDELEDRHTTLKDILEDCDLPSTKSEVKERFTKTEELINELFNDEISMKEIYVLSVEAPKYITDTENLLEDRELAEYILDQSDYYLYEDLEEPIDSADDLPILLYVVTGIFIFILVLGIAGAVTHSLNKVRYLKYFYLVILVAFVVGISVLIPMCSDAVTEMFADIPGMEEVSLQVTLMPYISLVLALVPVVLDIIFERKNKKLEV